MIASYYRRRI